MARIQGGGSSGFGGLDAQAVTLSAVASGSVVCGGIAWTSDSGQTLDSVTDNQGNTYTVYQTGGADATNGLSAALYYRANITNAPTVITANFTGGPSFRAIVADEFSGLATASIADGAHLNVQASSPGTGTDAITSGSITTTVAGNTVYGYTVNTSGAEVGSPGTGYTGATSVTQQDSEYLVQGSAGAIAATFTQAAGASRITGVLALKAAGASSAVSGAAASVATAAGTLTPNQIAAPIADISAGAWTPSSGGSLYPMLDEAAADDNDYISVSSTGSVAELRLAPLTDPNNAGARTLRYRLASPSSATLRLTLMQGATQIAQWTEVMSPTWTTYAHTLSAPEAAAITDYTDLRVRIDVP